MRGDGCVNRQHRAPIRALVADARLRPSRRSRRRSPTVCARCKLALIEDAAESLGSLYKGRHTGNLGRVSALSFNGNKIVTTGGGGAVLTNDAALGKRAKHLTTTARVPHRWNFIHDEVGYNYRLPNINAALGCAQLEQLPGIVAAQAAARRRAIAAPSPAWPACASSREPAGTTSNYWLNAIVLDAGRRRPRATRCSSALNDAGIMARPVWTLMHRLPMYAACPRMRLAVAEHIERRLINLPSSASWAPEAVAKRRICVVTGSRAEYGLLYWVMHDLRADAGRSSCSSSSPACTSSPEFGLTVRGDRSATASPSTRASRCCCRATRRSAIAKSIGLGVDRLRRRASSSLQPDSCCRARRPLRDPRRRAGRPGAQAFRVAHIAGGDTTEGAFDEAIRHAITKMAHLHFVDQRVRHGACASSARTRSASSSSAARARPPRAAPLLDRDGSSRRSAASSGSESAGHLPPGDLEPTTAERSSANCWRRSTSWPTTSDRASRSRTPTPAAARSSQLIDAWVAPRSERVQGIRLARASCAI